jgi:uncharacterized membrane protein
MTGIDTVVTLTLAAFIYGNLSLIIAAELQKAPFLVLLLVGIGWSTAFLVVFIAFAEKIINYFSRFKFFKKHFDKIKDKAKNYHKNSIAGTIIATIVPLPPFGIYAGAVIGLTLGFSKLKTFLIVWLANMFQFFVMYLLLKLVFV